jgi:molybdopterin synthase catalytic subunit
VGGDLSQVDRFDLDAYFDMAAKQLRNVSVEVDPLRQFVTVRSVHRGDRSRR